LRRASPGTGAFVVGAPARSSSVRYDSSMRLSSWQSLALAMAAATAACSSSNFEVAGGSTDGGDDTTQSGGDTTPGGDTGSSDTITSSDGSGGDATDDVPFADAPIDAIRLDAGACPGTTCPGSGSGASTCTDLESDPKNCGGCGKEVCLLEACSGGKSVCAEGLKPCSATAGCLGCKDVASDPLNCGTCGTKCGADQLCIGGSCVTTVICPTGTTRCAADGTSGTLAGCADLHNDVANCGACGASCSPGQYCVESACVDYTSAPGCATCPCPLVCLGKAQCCSYEAENVCASKCPPS